LYCKLFNKNLYEEESQTKVSLHHIITTGQPGNEFQLLLVYKKKNSSNASACCCELQRDATVEMRRGQVRRIHVRGTTPDVHTAVCFSMEADRNKTQPLRLYSFVVGSKQHEHFPLVLSTAIHLALRVGSTMLQEWLKNGYFHR